MKGIPSNNLKSINFCEDRPSLHINPSLKKKKQLRYKYITEAESFQDAWNHQVI